MLVGTAVVQHVAAHRDHFIGQDTGALLLHGQESQVESLEFILDGPQRLALRGVIRIGFEVVTNGVEAGVKVLANPADR